MELIYELIKINQLFNLFNQKVYDPKQIYKIKDLLWNILQQIGEISEAKSMRIMLSFLLQGHFQKKI